MVRIGAYPGSFDPPTVAHLAVAEAALDQGGLDAVHLILSRTPLGKAPTVPTFDDRRRVLEQVAATRPWLAVRITEQRLIAEVAAGYDAVIMGTDKWLQVTDPVWYGGSTVERDRAVAQLPPVLLAPRPGPPGGDRYGGLPRRVVHLAVHPGHGPVSSSLVRAGRVEWMLPEASEFDARTGAWSDPDRYRRLAEGAPTHPTHPASLPPMHDRGAPHS